MGFIKKLLGGILSFLGSIFSIFNIFKKSEYFLEADDAKSDSGTQENPAPEAPKVAPATNNHNSATQATVEAPAVSPVATTNGKVKKPVETVAAAMPVTAPATPEPSKAPVNSENSDESAEGLFATKYMISLSSTGGRRRPGPSLNRFMDMAKQVKS